MLNSNLLRSCNVSKYLPDKKNTECLNTLINYFNLILKTTLNGAVNTAYTSRCFYI